LRRITTASSPAAARTPTTRRYCRERRTGAADTLTNGGTLVRSVSLLVVAERSPDGRVAAPRSCDRRGAGALRGYRAAALACTCTGPDGAPESCACANWMLLAAGAGETPAAIPTQFPHQ